MRREERKGKKNMCPSLKRGCANKKKYEKCDSGADADL
jgi:hypothetical protein